MRFALLFLSCVLVSASDWPRFRGVNGTGVSSDKGLPEKISHEENLVWKVAAPKGNSSPIVVANRVWITGHDGDRRSLLCYDATTGKLIWRTDVIKGRSEVLHPLNGPTTPTPATDGKTVFVLFPDIGLLAFDLDGKELWRVIMGPFGAIQGFASSPVYTSGRVILEIDTPEHAYIAAFDSRSGKGVWRVERTIGWLGSYATPSVYTPRSGPAQIVVAGALELTGYDARTGAKLWWARGVTFAPAVLPLIADNSVYTLEPRTGEGGAPPFAQSLKDYDKNGNNAIDLTELTGDGINDRIWARIFSSIDKNAGDNDGKVTEEEFKNSFVPGTESGGLVRTRLGGKGDVSATHVAWRHTKGLPYVTAPILYGNVLYVIRNGGILSAFDPASGKLLREERVKEAIGEYYASPVAADGKIYLANKDGVVSVLRAGSDWTVLSTAKLDEQIIATPAIAGGRLYIRTDGTLYCFGATQTAA